MLKQLEIHRRIIQDFTLTTLALMPGLFDRLTYLASLRDPLTGRYAHEGLAAVYPGDAVQQALAECHEEVFERLLEISLALQEEDLRKCLETMPGGLATGLAEWRKQEFRQTLLPEQAPNYLKELFGSNLRALLELLRERSPKDHLDV
jgi:hypothetical protein